MLKRLLITGLCLFFPYSIWADQDAVGGADSDHKWMLDLPASGSMNSDVAVTARFVPTRGGGQSIRRHQKFYMAFYDNGGVVRMNKDGTADACSEGDPGECVSAPLFISSSTALICIDGDIGAAAADNVPDVRVKLCTDSTCKSTQVIRVGGALLETTTTNCGELGTLSNSYDGLDSGGQWLVVELISSPTSGGEVLVWVVGQ